MDAELFEGGGGELKLYSRNLFPEYNFWKLRKLTCIYQVWGDVGSGGIVEKVFNFVLIPFYKILAVI